MASLIPRSGNRLGGASIASMSLPIDPLASESPQPRTPDERGDGRRRAPGRDSRPGTSAGVEALRNRVYGFNDLSHYGRRDRFIIRAAGVFFYLLIRVICSTLRWEVRGREHLDSILSGEHRPIFTFWHVCILTATWFWRNRGIVVMSSTSRDAEYTGRVIKRFGYGTARGSATRGGGRALAEMAECLENGMEVAFTIDGPRGPAYVAKPGAVTLARHTGQAILPFHIAARRYIELRSWDRLQIPLPFTRAAALIAEPIYVPREATSEEVAAKQAELQSALDRLLRDAEAWRERSKERERAKW
jgi:lysophospholipid acyltransferase (LPLAT)-like uncharacterized protein